MLARREIAPLTGLRGVASLMVVIAHYIGWTWVPDGPRPDLSAWTSISGVAMAIFFTLSGYVIALSYSHWDWGGRPVFNLLRLLLYRLARLYPAYLLFAVICIMRAPDYRNFLDPEVRDYLLPHLALVFTWYRVPFQGGHSFPPESPFHLGWSLSVEWALYSGFALAAILLTVLRTCELHDFSPVAYLEAVLVPLRKLGIRKDNDKDAAAEFDALTPARWKAARQIMRAG